MKTQEEERLWDKKIIVPTSAEISQAKICAEEINKAHGGEHLRNSFTEGEQTALGLLAAIPAVIAYNKFNSDSQRYFARVDNFSKRFLSII